MIGSVASIIVRFWVGSGERRTPTARRGASDQGPDRSIGRPIAAERSWAA